jgi:DNA primase
VAFVVDNEIKDRVRSSTDIVDLIGSYISLRRQGANFVGLCPFHDDRKPSMQVNVARQSWKCWVCDVGGDVFSFLMQKEQLSFPEALNALAQRAGIELPKERSSSKGSSDNKQQLYEAMAWVVQQYQTCLKQDSIAQAAREYLAQRGLTDESIDRFKIGFAPDSWNYLCDRFTQQNKPLDVLDQIGVVSKSERGSVYDRFRGRVIFPIADAQGRFISMGGRVLPGSDDQAKYVNCSETRLYQKHQTLYGLDLARTSIAKSRTAIVMEGYTDVMMASQFGVPNVVAVCGTALGEGHMRILQRYCDQIVLLLDGDDAGRRRATEILNLFMGYPIDLRVVTLPDDLDPCDFLVAHGADAIREHIANAVDALEFMISSQLGDIDPYVDTHRANAALEQTLITLSKSTAQAMMPADAASLRRDQMLLRVAKRFGVEVPQLRSRMESIRQRENQRKAVRQTFQRDTQRSANDQLASIEGDFVEEAHHVANVASSEVRLSYRELSAMERELFEIFVQREDLIPLALEQFDDTTLQTNSAKALFQTYVECDFRGIDLKYDSVMAAVEDPQIKSLLVSIETEATLKNAKVPMDGRERLLMLCERLANSQTIAEQTRMMHQLQASDLDAAAELELLQQSLQANRDTNHKLFRIPGL